MSLHKFLIFTSLALPVASTAFSAIIPMPSDNFDGLEGRIFPYTTLADPSGTTAVFTGDLFIANIDNAISGTSASCFSNIAGFLTVLGRGYTLSFSNIRSAANGAAISDLVTDTSQPLIMLGFKNLLFLNSHTLTSTVPDTTGTTGAGTTGTTTGTAGTTTAKLNAAMLYSTTPVILKDNETIIFRHNRSAGSGTGITAASLTVTGTTKLMSFDSNASASVGGALTSQGPVYLVNNQAPITFLSNGAAYYGGAIYLKESTSSLTAISNPQDILFRNNSARTGGAIYSEGNITFSGNGYTLFSSNTASPGDAIPTTTTTTATSGLGGAIYCIAPATTAGGGTGGTATTTGGTATTPKDPSVTFSGQEHVYFYGNYAATQGGAIYAKQIVFTNNAMTRFVGNSSMKGGAIAVAPAGTLALTASNGNISFDQNLTITASTGSTVNQAGTRNSVHFGEGATFSTLAATAGNSIFFFDPITTDIPTTPPTPPDPSELKINDKTTSEGFQGSIVFSGETLSSEEVGKTENLTSTINQKVTLDNGYLILKGGVTLNVHSLTQTAGSTVVMDAGTTLDTIPATGTGGTPATNGNISLNNLAINLPTLTTTGPGATVKVSSTSGTLTVAGPITLVDDSGIFYENHDLLNQATAIFPIATLTGPTAAPTLTDTVAFAGLTSSPYGYQGTWTFTSTPSTGTPPPTTTQITATWTKTGYIPSPERLAPLVPNSLWGNVVDLRAINQAMETCSRGFPYGKGFCLTGISNFFHCDHTGSARGFRHISGGYVVHANSQTVSDSVFGFGFGQLFAKSKDYLVGDDKSKVYLVTAYTGFTKPFFNVANMFASMAARASYSRSNERLTTSYSLLGKTHAAWSNNCWLGEIEANLPIKLSSGILNLRKLTPFVKANVAYANQGEFEEQGSEGRSFGHGHLVNVAIPVGLKFDKNSHRTPDFYSISVAYIPDVYRCDPSCQTILLANNASWTTVATNQPRNALSLQAASHTKVNNNIEFYGHGGCEIRESSRQYTLDVGSKLRF